MVTVKFKRLQNGEGLPLPAYQSDGAAGMDLCSAQRGTILPGERVVIKCGFAIECPEGYEVQVRSRSGLAAKQGVFVLNSPGTIDSDYRGEVQVTLQNNDLEDVFVFERGDRIAQLVVKRVDQVTVEEVDSLSDTIRGTGGLGSTGR